MKTTRALTLSLGTMLLGLLFLALGTPTARANAPVIVRVKVGGATSDPCGGTWDGACDLQYALTSTVGAAELWVAAGTYKPTTVGDRTSSFELREGIALYGGFAGDESLRSDRNITTNVTILSGDIGTPNVASDNSYHVVTGSGVMNAALLDGFTVTGGRADGGYPHDRGAGIYNYGGSPMLTNVIFSGNRASSGGGMYNDSSHPTLMGVTFSGNSATNTGGGIYNTQSSPALTNVTFSSNTAAYDGGGMLNANSSNATLTNVTFSGNRASSGGGMYNDSSHPTLMGVTFSSNSADQYGAGMYNYSGSPTLNGTSFSGNTATYGGGVYNYSGSPTLNGTTFSGNTATNSGGGMFNSNNSSPTLTNVTFSGNAASSNDGGGMANYSSHPTLTNVTFSSNTAGQNGGGMSSWNNSNATLTNVTFLSNIATNGGGGMYNDSSNPTLTNVTFSGNLASSGGGIDDHYGSPIVTNVTFSGNWALRGGGIYDEYYSGPTVRDAILWGNTAPVGAQLYGDSMSTPSLSDSVVQDGYVGGTNIIDHDPLLGPLGNWGGSTPTIPLLSGSSAIDMGNNIFCATIPIDQRGKPRVGTCDIGAFEFQGYTLTKAHGDHQSTVITTPFADSLEVTLTETGSSLLLPDAILTFTAPSSGAGVAWSGNLVQTATTNASGAASVAPPTANGTAGTSSVIVTVSGAAAPAVFELTNAQAETKTAITASANPIVAGQPLTFTITVDAVAPASGTPTGTVELYETTSHSLDVRGTRRALATHPLVSGVATIAVPSLARGAHTLLAIYSGDANYHPSTSALHTQNAFLFDTYMPLLEK